MRILLILLAVTLSLTSFSQRKVLKKTEHYTIFVSCDSIKMNETGQLKFRVKLAKEHKFQKDYDPETGFIIDFTGLGLKIKDREIKFSGDDVLDLNYNVKRTAKKITFNGSIEFGIEGKPLQRVPFKLTTRNGLNSARSSNDPIFFLHE